MINNNTFFCQVINETIILLKIFIKIKIDYTSFRQPINRNEIHKFTKRIAYTLYGTNLRKSLFSRAQQKKKEAFWEDSIVQN